MFTECLQFSSEICQTVSACTGQAEHKFTPRSIQSYSLLIKRIHEWWIKKCEKECEVSSNIQEGKEKRAWNQVFFVGPHSLSLSELQFLFFFLFFFLLFLCAAPTACGGSQARGRIGAVVTGLHHSHSNAGSEPRLQPTPQLMATPDH